MGDIETSPRLRVAAVVVRGNLLLVVRHRKGGREYFMLPGGGVTRGETMGEALYREVDEETGLQVQAGKLLCVSETIFPDGSRHIVNMVFKGIEKGGKLRPSRDARVVGVEFVSFSDLEVIDLLPPIGPYLVEEHGSGFTGGAEYLGRLWREME